MSLTTSFIEIKGDYQCFSSYLGQALAPPLDIWLDPCEELTGYVGVVRYMQAIALRYVNSVISHGIS